MKLIIVESPTKAKTISKFLGSDFKVESSFGHVRDLPVSKLGVDIEHNFAPQYVIPPKAKPHIKHLKDAAKKAREIILATDEDREGEAIAWHLAEALGLERGERIVFHEITKHAIEEALKHPRDIDMHLVDAQQARRVLDRLVGYKLSPFLWKKLMRGLSAGRVQSVALRLVVEREEEREKFKKQEYWTIAAQLKIQNEKLKVFEAILIKKDNKTFDKFAIKNEQEAKTIAKELECSTFRVAQVEKKQVQRNPLPPYTTSTLQQDASQRLGLSAKQTMRLAQQLYETGAITYMRTDSVNLSAESRRGAFAYLKQSLGAPYALSAEGRSYKTKSKGAQEAHEAIRPTDPAHTLDNKLYDLIRRRFLASQMPPALFDAVVIDVSASKSAEHKTQNTEHKYILRATGQTIRFDGFLKMYPMSVTERDLPPLAEHDALTLENILPQQHFTEPPPRYTEATLIKALEQEGIGRPSTYAPTMALIQERGYVEKDERKRLSPALIGKKITEMLVTHFPRVVDIKFTARMEEELDEIAEGTRAWVPVIEEFYEPFEKNLQEKYESVRKQNVDKPTDETCEACGKPMVIKHGRFGEFLACSGFPECKNTKKIPPPSTGVACPKCQKGEIVIRSSKRGRKIYGCSTYPTCDYVANTPPTPQQ